MEAHKAFASMRFAKSNFRKSFSNEIADVKRDSGTNAQDFARNLAAADLALTNYLDECEQRLERAIDEVLRSARVVNSSNNALGRTAAYLTEPTDDMIVSTILEDAANFPSSRIGFFSEDGDFAIPSLRAAMRALNVEHLANVQSCLDWYSAL
jgi:hypothetical protein